MTSAVEWWGTYGVHEPQDKVLQLAPTVGCDGPCSHTPHACTSNNWLSLIKFQGALSLKQLVLLLHVG